MALLYQLIRAVIHIRQLGVRRQLKVRMFASWLMVFLLKRYDATSRKCRLIGFEVNFCTYRMLAFLFNEIFIEQEYCFASDNARPYIIDCGSNIGMSILYFKLMYPQATILAFEPGEEAFSRLEVNIRNNHLRSVTLHKTALSSREGTLELYYDPDDPGCGIVSTRPDRLPRNSRTVQASRLSRYIDREVDLLKMDVEGAELEIIEELSNARKLHCIKQMVIEYHHHIPAKCDVLSQMLRLLENAGFGYQLGSHLKRPFQPERYQNVRIYAYQKQAIQEDTALGDCCSAHTTGSLARSDMSEISSACK